MSEEEIIKRLKNTIEINKIFLGCDIQENSNIYKDIQGLLDLYNKEKEKNDLLVNGTFDMFKKVLEEEFTKRYISKDKIKARIEQIKMNANYDWTYKYDYQDVVKILKELLEEV